jgi:hypothetical protein
MPLVTVSRPMPRVVWFCQPRPCSSSSAPSGAAQIGRAAIAVRLADGVTAGRQRHGFLVVHRHAREGDAHVVGRLERIGLAVDAFRFT